MARKEKTYGTIQQKNSEYLATLDALYQSKKSIETKVAEQQTPSIPKKLKAYVKKKTQILKGEKNDDSGSIEISKANLQLAILQLDEKIREIQASQAKLSAEYRLAVEPYENAVRYVDFPYTPYSSVFDTPEIREQGFQYLTLQIQAAWKGWEFSKVKSLVGSRDPISETFPPEIALVLNIIERMDYQVYYERDGKTLKSPEKREAIMLGQTHKALTTFALNREGAYNWQRSQVGALGIGQFMRNTFRNFMENTEYRSVIGESNTFEKAAKDHITSFRMQGLHFKDETRAFPEALRKNWDILIKDDATRMGLYALIAAGYNGGMSRILREVFQGIDFGNLRSVRARLEPNSIMKALEQAKIVGVSARSVRAKLLGETKGLTEIKLQEFIREEVQKELNMHQESETYILKFFFVWKYLKANFEGFDEGKLIQK